MLRGWARILSRKSPCVPYPTLPHDFVTPPSHLGLGGSELGSRVTGLEIERWQTDGRERLANRRINTLILLPSSAVVLTSFAAVSDAVTGPYPARMEEIDPSYVPPAYGICRQHARSTDAISSNPGPHPPTRTHASINTRSYDIRSKLETKLMLSHPAPVHLPASTR